MSPSRLPPPASRLAIVLRVFLPFACGYFLSYLYRTVNAVIAPDLIASLSLNAADLGLLTSMYFLTFAFFQLPLGMLLDRYGPRRVEALLLLFAAIGALIFALSSGRVGLICGRALIGLGVSACLMAGFKAFVVWFPPARLPAVNGWIMAAGGLGALSSTTPVEIALQIIDWRGLFLGLSLTTLIISAILYRLVPDQSGQTPREALGKQWRGVRDVFSSRQFWRVAPLATCSQATFLSIQGLWVGPWLRDVAGLERLTAAHHLLATAVAMVAGYLFMGNLAYRLTRFGITPLTVASGGILVFMVTQLAIILEFTDHFFPLWVLFGFFGTSGIVVYAALSQSFPAHLAGRVNTGLNWLVFMAAFLSQWGIGAIIDGWPEIRGESAINGYQAAFSLMLLLQTASFAWFLFGQGNRRKPTQNPKN
ncbi:MAG: MFS transporter [Gammaproteobacteria bacterium]|nr:MFS transporter [Gammaproteobacteria bacterium]MCP5424449.1 MFS transporter [Gammaproteobacteria bacterium]